MTKTDKEYSGAFYGISAGGGLSIPPIPVSVGSGTIIVASSELLGAGRYTLASSGYSAIPLAISFSKTDYKPTMIQSYVPEGMNVYDQHIEQMKTDIQSGLDSPAQLSYPKERQDAIDRLDKVYDTYKYFFNAHYDEFRKRYGYGKIQ